MWWDYFVRKVMPDKFGKYLIENRIFAGLQ
jgi:hypothetical protein